MDSLYYSFYSKYSNIFNNVEFAISLHNFNATIIDSDIHKNHNFINIVLDWYKKQNHCPVMIISSHCKTKHLVTFNKMSPLFVVDNSLIEELKYHLRQIK